MKDNFKIKGQMELVLFKADGTVETRFKDNMILDVGFDFIADAIGKASGRPNVMSHIAIGSGTTAVAAGQTALVTEIDRNAATYAHTPGTKVFTLSATFGAGEGVGAITEAGVVNAGSAGTFIDRVVFAVINKGTSDTLTVTFSFTLSEV